VARWDDLLNDAFEKAFPEYLDDARLSNLTENEIKSAEGKRRWREFMMPFEKIVHDYNFGTLIRLDAEGEYDEQNAMFGTSNTPLGRGPLPVQSAGGHISRWAHQAQVSLGGNILTHFSLCSGYRTQFYAIEIARNRRGLNDKVWAANQKA